MKACIHSRCRQLGWLFVLLPLLAVGCGEHKSPSQVCADRQAEVWDAAVNYFVDHHLSPDDLIDPRRLASFFPDGQVPHCPLGNENYAPFTILDGPKCPHQPGVHVVSRIPAGIAKLKRDHP